MQTLFGLVLPAPVLWVLALVFVLALVAIFGLILRRISGRRARLKGQSGARARQPRLGVIDIYDLDRQRQLVLLRRDNVEHLVMIGGPSDVVVETNILRGGVRPAANPSQDGTGSDRLDGDTVYYPAPPVSVPVATVPPAAPAPIAAPAPASPALETSIPTPTRPAAASAAVGAAGAAAVATASAFGRTPVATETVLAETVPAEAPLPEAVPAPVAVDTPVTQGSPVKAEPKPVFPLESAPAPKPPAGDLDDMARQLEQALKRPFAAVRSSTPVPAAPVPAAPVAAAPVEAVLPEVKAPEAKVPEPAVPEIRAPEVKAPEIKVPEVKVPEVKTPEIKAPELVETPAAAPAPSSSSFEAFMEEQLKATVEAAPVVEVVEVKAVEVATVVAAPVSARLADKAPELPDAIAAELQAAMADSFKVLEPVKEPARAVDPPKATTADVGAVETAAPVPASLAVKDKPSGDSKPDEAKTADPATPGAKPAEGGEADPFSIDAIEMEFARLLGRDTKPKT